MELNGRKASNPGAELASLLGKRQRLQDELRNIERQVFELETTYLQGQVLKGVEGLLMSSKSSTNLKRPRKFQPEDRIFSLSSVTSPAGEDNTGGRDDFGPGRSKGGALPANGQGKPRKPRLAS